MTVSRAGLWMSLSVVAAVLASTAQRLASLQSLDPACLVKNNTENSVSVTQYLTLHESVALQTFHKSVSLQVSTVSRDPRLLLQCQVYLVVFVQQATTVQRAAVYPHPAQLDLTRMRLEEKAKMTANLVLLVNKKLFCIKSYFSCLSLFFIL